MSGYSANRNKPKQERKKAALVLEKCSLEATLLQCIKRDSLPVSIKSLSDYKPVHHFSLVSTLYPQSSFQFYINIIFNIKPKCIQTAIRDCSASHAHQHQKHTSSRSKLTAASHSKCAIENRVQILLCGLGFISISP